MGEIGLAGRVQRKVPTFFFSGKVSPNFDPKNMMSTYTKGVLMEKMIEISRISKNFISNRHLFMFQYVAKNIEGFCNFFYFHI